MSYRFGMFNRSNVFTFALLPLLSSAASICKDFSLTWSTVPWHIRLDPFQETDTVVALPPFVQPPEFGMPECIYESVIYQCQGCDQNILFDSALDALRIRSQSLLGTA